MGKQWLGIDVLTAAKRRIAKIFDHFPKIYLSGPSGKDSGVMMHLVCQEARRRGRKVGVLYVDLEAQYESTIAFVEKMFAEYADVIEPYWLCLPVALRNAVSQYQPKWTAWEPGAAWVRQPPKIAITDPAALPWYTTVMEFEEIVPAFAEWYAQGQPCACFVGIRAQESLNRWRAVTRKANRWHDPDSHEPVLWTTWKGETVFNPSYTPPAGAPPFPQYQAIGQIDQRAVAIRAIVRQERRLRIAHYRFQVASQLTA